MHRHTGRSRALVSSWLDFQPVAARALIEALRQAVREAEPALAETVKWGNLVYVLEGLPVLGLAPVKGHVNLQLLQGAPWPSGLAVAEATGRGARHWRFDVGTVVDPVLVEQLVSSATRHGRRLLDERPPRAPVPDPED